MGGAAAPPREVRLTGPGGSGESGRLLTRASERGRLSRRVARGIRSALHSGHSWIPLPSAGLLVLPESLPCLPLSSICTPSREIPLSGLAVPRPRIPAPPASLLACYSPAPRNCPLPSHPPGTFILTPPCAPSVSSPHPRPLLVSVWILPSWPALPPWLTGGRPSQSLGSDLSPWLDSLRPCFLFESPCSQLCSGPPFTRLVLRPQLLGAFDLWLMGT